ncbi:MAG: exodeoxyribonuclease VII small subunit [Deltaproteobacteria bacterium RIFCSPLOWO2_12_FULL_43_16]|nr:MAG: exodeoxyribonuclease VII small subunit [Deltaproteobacteria bacterium GWA2_43_19]OGQ11822.1 MAG: exodeoxyribonuclease VII small subunit [Deltaproteobacteria bacterium RIFCSPHIGHO2_02_FULL_43_33]OGQ34095.1 MAG: exodeoxyribonuclease VII small subunit [Deltaproteobacteria bacterium RIFCSPLOWO2_01_FULL_42_9]OGQ61004.1 MAG: exodeoxyribonuclease VII small subunit [Deltaproteobacteria bacterium RIFCSPLOWO2_12_FULL_43_16]HBR17423.1 exodeoxyribonuclease VII small subunit [Deltaproteobacteria bac
MAEIKFEDALKRLEEIVDILERGELPLEKSLKIFEEGVRLSRLCNKMLDKAEKKVEILMQDEKGEIGVKPFEPAKE